MCTRGTGTRWEEEKHWMLLVEKQFRWSLHSHMRDSFRPKWVMKRRCRNKALWLVLFRKCRLDLQHSFPLILVLVLANDYSWKRPNSTDACATLAAVRRVRLPATVYTYSKKGESGMIMNESWENALSIHCMVHTISWSSAPFWGVLKSCHLLHSPYTFRVGTYTFVESEINPSRNERRK